MMKISKKCQYALRAILELSLRNADNPVKIRDIANAQKVSLRFMETILNELKHGGFIESRRGRDGGYALTKPAENITVGEIIEYIQGPISVVSEKHNSKADGCNAAGAFEELWKEINNAISDICNNKTFSEIAEIEVKARKTYKPDYAI
ncbi:MAG: Rrf2 family transcriptional regulator [Phycisphaerae bacterium]|jgi:Rrf2 family protein